MDTNTLLLKNRAKALMQKCGTGSVRNDSATAIAEEDAPVSFETFPGWVEYCRQENAFSKGNIRNPYFSMHEGISAATVKTGGRELINFSGYNYLDLAGNPQVIEQTVAAVREYGPTVSASRVISGEIPLHQQLEKRLAQFLGMEEAVAFVSGYATNVATLGHLFGPGDLILHDALIHNSALTGAKLSGARRIPFLHNDYTVLDRLLTENRKQFRHVVIVTEGVFSMDGDIPDLPRLIEIKKRHRAFLMVDEAHSLGVLGATGRGIAEHFGVPASEIDIWMGTLSKSLASCGGVIAGSHALIANLRLTAPGGILYSVGLTPANTAAALAALTVLSDEPQRVQKLSDNCRHFLARLREAGLNVGLAQDTSVIPIILGNSLHCLEVASRLFDLGIQVHPILYPAVSETASRLRFFITAGHTEEQLNYTADSVCTAIASVCTGRSI